MNFSLIWNFKDYTQLTLGELFNQPIDHLPNSITHLILGECFNIEIKKLPESLTNLTFGNIFNKKINNLPSSIIIRTTHYLNLDSMFGT